MCGAPKSWLKYTTIDPGSAITIEQIWHACVAGFFVSCFLTFNSSIFIFRGYIKWPINWDGASKAAEKADMILCLGSSLKVLRRYPWLWCMDRPKKLRPPLYIVNLQWTPKDSAATLKLNGRCDEIMKNVMVSS